MLCDSIISNFYLLFSQKIPEIADAAATAVVKHHMFGKSLVDVAMKALSTASPSEIIRLVTSLSELGVYSVPFKDAVSDQVREIVDKYIDISTCSMKRGSTKILEMETSL